MLMTAKEAREKLEQQKKQKKYIEAKNKSIEKEKKYVEKLITNAVKRNEWWCRVNCLLNTETENWLYSLGYQCKARVPADFTDIIW